MIKLGLVGEKLGHSLSPKIHSFIFEKIGIKGSYNLYEFEKSRSENILDTMIKNGVDGFNITVPYKEVLFDKLTWVSKEAREIGAINTVAIKGGNSYGYNTDYYGVIKIFEKSNYNVKDKICYVLGSGGACKAVVVALKNMGASRIIVVTRNLEKTKNMLERFPYIEMVEYKDIERGDVIINTTPVGMYPDIVSTPLDEEKIKRFEIAVDLIYNPGETKFLSLARKNGLTTENGLSMLIEQAIKAEEIWLEKDLGKELYSEVEKFLLEV